MRAGPLRVWAEVLGSPPRRAISLPTWALLKKFSPSWANPASQSAKLGQPGSWSVGEGVRDRARCVSVMTRGCSWRRLPRSLEEGGLDERTAFAQSWNFALPQGGPTPRKAPGPLGSVPLLLFPPCPSEPKVFPLPLPRPSPRTNPVFSNHNNSNCQTASSDLLTTSPAPRALQVHTYHCLTSSRHGLGTHLGLCP